MNEQWCNLAEYPFLGAVRGVINILQETFNKVINRVQS